MEQARASDRTFALLYRTRWRGLGRILNDLDRDSVAGLLRGDESLKLLKLDEIKLFLVQVRPQLRHRRQDDECDQ